MKAFLLLAALTTMTALPAAANIHSDVSGDPLMRQIQALNLTRPNGGVTAAVKVKGADKGINLELTDPSAALAPLAPVAGLVAPAEDAAPAVRPKARRKTRRAERPVEQAEVIEGQGERAAWENVRK